MTQQEYWNEIRSLAEWLSDNRPTELGGGGVTADYGEDADRYDAMHETLDGHEFVIYTHKARQVIVHSDNPDHMIDEMGADAGGDMFDERRAYWAMQQDIIDRDGMEERFDLDELRTERFEGITGADEFVQWVKKLVGGEQLRAYRVRLPNWSSALVTECHEVEGQDLTLEWMPNNSADVQTVTVTDEHCNEVVIQISNRKAA